MQYHLQSKLLTNLEITSKKHYKKPLSWPDIRKNAKNGHIYLLVDDRYPIGFVAAVSGGYSVKIDGIAYGDYESLTQFSMADWSSYSATQGYAIDYPAGASKAHIIDIFPQTENENITAFHCARVAASGSEAQGVLWEHFNLTNSIDISYLNATGSLPPSNYYNPNLVACTAKNNTINFTEIQRAFLKCEKLNYLPSLKHSTSDWLEMGFTFANCYLLEKVNFKNTIVGSGNYCFYNCRKLKEIIGLEYTSALTVQLSYYITNSAFLKDMILDLSSLNKLKGIGCLGSSSYFMSGFKGLRVSSSAPFNYATSPQIDVSYTGMDRAALVQLFNDLPSVSGGQVINITGSTGSEDLTAEDKAIATNKGWSITE